MVALAAVSSDLRLLAIGDVQRVGGILHPRRSVLLEVVDLQFGDGRVARVDVFAFFDQRLREVLAPGLFQLLNLPQCGLDLVRGHHLEGLIQLVIERAQPVVHPVDFARVAAQQVIAEVEAVLHHLEADGVGGIRELPLAVCSRCTADQFTRNSTSTIARMMPKFVYNFFPIVMPVSSAVRPPTAAQT